MGINTPPTSPAVSPTSSASSSQLCPKSLKLTIAMAKEPVPTRVWRHLFDWGGMCGCGGGHQAETTADLRKICQQVVPKLPPPERMCETGEAVIEISTFKAGGGVKSGYYSCVRGPVTRGTSWIKFTS